MIQHLTHKVRTRRANHQLDGLLAIPRHTAHQTGVVTDLGIELGIHPTIPGLFFAGGLLGARAFKQVSFVRWSSPCLDESHEHADMRAFERRFGDCACTLPAFMRAMNWLDAVCFGAADLESVQRACETNPEYGLICEDATRLEEALLRPERSHDL